MPRFSLAAVVMALCCCAALANPTLAQRNQQVIEQYFDGVFLSSNFDLDRWLEEHVALDGLFQFCPLTALNLPSNPYPHCTNSQGKKAYLRYVELDQSNFGNTKLANVSYAVSANGLEVFSRYMVTGTLEGEPVPWFDQMLAWTFDSAGQIKRTVFWTDTLYWNQLYKQTVPAVEQQSIGLMGRAPHTAFDFFLALFFACGFFVAGVAVGAQLRSDAKTQPLLSA